MIQNKEIEIYGIVKDVDRSILTLNPIIKKDGYEFIFLKLRDLKVKFSKLFEFNWFRFEQFGEFNSNTNLDREIYLLKKSENPCVMLEEDKTLQIGFHLTTDKSFAEELAIYLRILSIKLKSARSEHINFQGAFSILRENRVPVESFLLKKDWVSSQFFRQKASRFKTNESNFKYSIKEEDLSRLKLYDSEIIKKTENKYRLAIHYILERDWNGFSHTLKEAFDILPSGLERFYEIDEFKEIIDKKISASPFGPVKWIRDDLHLGFLYLGMDKFDKAYEHLSKVIDENIYGITNDLPYLLRGMIPPSANPNVRDDITTAYFLRPSARALFLHYKFLDENVFKKEENSKTLNKSFLTGIEKENYLLLHFLNRIIQKTPDPIIYLMRSKYRGREEREEDIMNSYFLDPNYIPTIGRYAFLNGISKEEKLECLLRLKKHGVEHPTAIAKTYFDLKNYMDALEYYESVPILSLVGNEVEFLNISGKKAVVKINDEDIIPMNVYRYFEESSFSYKNILNYFICKIINNKSDFIFGEGNPIFDRIIELRDSFRQKCSSYSYSSNNWNDEEVEELLKSGKVSEEEVNSCKLMLYELNYEIGFGVHKGKKLVEILKENPENVIDKILNLIHFSVHPYVFLDERIRANPKFLKALEVNLIKVKILAEKFISSFYESPGDYNHYSSEDSYYDGGGGSEWSDPFQFTGG